MNFFTFNRDSAVPTDAMSEEHNGSLPLSGYRSLVVNVKSKTYNGEVRRCEKDFGTLQLGAFATPGLLLAQWPIDLTAESGFNLRIGFNWCGASSSKAKP